MPAKKFLEFYASQLNSVEVNYNFRALPTLKMLEGWLAASHASFRLRRSAVYSSAEIAAFATRFNALAQQRATYIYFKHEDEPTGALSATALLAAAAAEAGLRG